MTVRLLLEFVAIPVVLGIGATDTLRLRALEHAGNDAAARTAEEGLKSLEAPTFLKRRVRLDQGWKSYRAAATI